MPADTPDLRLAFTVPGPPHGKGRPRAARMASGLVRMYVAPLDVSYEDRVALHAVQAMPLGWRPLLGPIGVTITTYRTRPRSPGRQHEARAGVVCAEDAPHRYCSSKPDADNCAKSVMDGLSVGGVWRDDAQVAVLHVVALWCEPGEAPRTAVTVAALGEP